MAFTIPSAVFTPYYEACDELINNAYIGKTITLYRTESIAVNDGQLNLAGGPSINVGPDGELDDYSQFGGTSYKQVESTTTMRVRWYEDPKDWKRLVELVIPETKVIIIGFIGDLNKLRDANQIGRDFGGKTQKYVLSTEPRTHGFGEDYFLAQLKAA